LRGAVEGETVIGMTRLYVNEAKGEVDLWSRELLAAWVTSDELRTMLAAARRLTKYTHRRLLPPPRDREGGDYSVYDLVGDSEATIGVSSSVNKYRLAVGVVATPSSIESNILSVTIYGADAPKIAWTILASVRFDRDH
jgi:hypothetical protein